MTAAELRALILDLAADHPARVAFADGRDADCAALLGEPAVAGYVPDRWLVAVLASRNLWGLALLASRFRLLPDGSPCPLPLFTLFATAELAAFGTFDPPLQFEAGPLTAGLDSLIGSGLLTADDRAAILAGEVRLPLAAVTPADVEAARTRA